MSSNFSFLAEHSPLLADLGATTEKLFAFDPASCVLKLRLLAEALTQETAARIGLRLVQATQADLLRAVDQRLGLDPQLRQMFHLLRQRGNEAAHQADHRIGYREALEALKLAREVALWFHRTIGPVPGFKPAPLVLPVDPSQKLAALQQQMAALQHDLRQAQTAQAALAQLAHLLEAQAAQERAVAERAAEERGVYESLADQASARYATLKAEFDARILASSALPSAPTAQEIQSLSQRAAQAAQQVAVDEATTRLLIDQMLIEAGWEADNNELTHAKGARPERHKNKAIAEWPTQGQQNADYLLFAGLTPVAALEAKRLNINVAGKIAQAERCARGLVLEPEHEAAAGLTLATTATSACGRRHLVQPDAQAAEARAEQGPRLFAPRNS